MLRDELDETREAGRVKLSNLIAERHAKVKGGVVSLHKFRIPGSHPIRIMYLCEKLILCQKSKNRQKS